MKRIWNHPEVKSERRYWRSVGEYQQTPEFTEKLGREFDPGLSAPEEKQTETRRDFIKIMGGIAAVASLASCRRPVEKILPFTKHVEWIIPGKSLLYATTMPRPWGATPMVVVTHEGRPTHLQGNPYHPGGGGLDIFAQASVLDLYNDNRVKQVTHRKKELSWLHFQKAMRKWSEEGWSKGGEGLAILTSPSSSPTRTALYADLAKAFPKAKVYSYSPVAAAGEAAAVKAGFGEGVQLVPNFEKAERIFSLDSDFLGLDGTSDNGTKQFMKWRGPAKASDQMNRLYVLENRYTLTGGIADHRLPVAASLIPQAAAVLAEEVAKALGGAAGGLAEPAAKLAEGVSGDLREWIAVAAKDLVQQKGKSLVLAGARQGEAVQALVLSINQALGALGTTLEAFKVESVKTAGGIAELVAEIKADKVKQLIITAETDPAFDAPEFEAAVKATKEMSVVHLACRPNYTSRISGWVLPAAHYLESWGDARCTNGTYCITQPMIQPLFGGASEIDLLLAMLGRKHIGPVAPHAPAPADPKAPAAPAPAAPAPVVEESDAAYEAVKATFAKLAGGWDEEKWNITLRDGFLVNSAVKPVSVQANAGALTGLVGKGVKVSAPAKDSVELVLTADASIYDGRYTDNAWLQEAPDPITKLTWDNAAWISVRTFRELGLREDGDLVKVTVNGRELTLPAIQCPGHAHHSVTIPLGYGQKVGSAVGKDRGFNAYPLRSSVSEFILTGAKLEKADGRYELAITQENYTMEARAQVREGTKERFDKDEDFAATEGMDSHIPPVLTLYKGRVGRKSDENPTGFDYEHEHQWGMVIDLSKCLGCSACIVACQSENNIAVVGKEQVRMGRVMQWVRMDRYYSTSDDVTTDPPIDELDNPEMVSQPVSCQQCEAAPCETVCPVNATVHTQDGLNAMAYNRCIGTRYCANNCPYTARRFNFFDWNKRNPFIKTEVAGIKMNNLKAGPFGEKAPQEVQQLQKNPNVTVRMRGVIEKCTYCVQRLEEAKIRQRRIAKDDATKLRVPDGNLKVACQASCAADAVTFGDLANPESEIVKAKANPRNYELLKYIGTRPRTSYLARIRNVNPDIPDKRTRKSGEASIYNI